MKLNLVPVIIFGILAGIILGSCDKKTNVPKTTSKAKVVDNKACKAAAADAIGGVPGVKLALADMTLGADGIDVSSQSASATTNTIGLNIDYSALALGAVNKGTGHASPTSIAWKICSETKPTNCLNNGKFKVSPDFNIGNIIGLPTGVLQVSVKLCVNSLNNVADEDQASAVNECTKEAPCYCGPVTTTQYMNSVDSSNTDPTYAKAVTNATKLQDGMLPLASAYTAAAQAFMNHCQRNPDQNAADIQYATNVASGWSPAEMVTYIQSYGEEFSAMMASLQQGLGLAETTSTADAACAAIAGAAGDEQPDTEEEEEPAGDTPKMANATEPSPSPSGGGEPTPITPAPTGGDTGGGAPKISTTESSSETDTTTGTGMSTGTRFAIGIFAGAVVLVGIAMMVNSGMKMAGKGGIRSNLGGMSDKWGLRYHTRGLTGSWRDANRAMNDMDRALLKGDDKAFKKALKQHEYAVKAMDREATKLNDGVKKSGAADTEPKPKKTSSTSRALNDALENQRTYATNYRKYEIDPNTKKFVFNDDGMKRPVTSDDIKGGQKARANLDKTTIAERNKSKSGLKKKQIKGLLGGAGVAVLGGLAGAWAGGAFGLAESSAPSPVCGEKSNFGAIASYFEGELYRQAQAIQEALEAVNVAAAATVH